MPIYVVVKSPIARLVALAKSRGWDSLVMLSTAGNTLDADYHGDTSKLSPAMRAERGYEDGKDDEPIFNVFRKDGDTIRHFWASELTFAPEDPDQHHRMGDLVDPVWGLLDMAPGRARRFLPEARIQLEKRVHMSAAYGCRAPNQFDSNRIYRGEC